MSKSEDLKQTAQLRKAIMPLVGLLKAEANKEIAERFDKIEAMLGNFKVEVKAPDVNVNVPDVNVKVEQPKELIKSLEKASAPTPMLPKYEPHDQAGGAIKYSGFVSPDGSWYIQRISKNQQRYAKGQGDYSEAWEKRGKLKYGYIDGK